MASWAICRASSSGSFLPPAMTMGTGQAAVTVSKSSHVVGLDEGRAELGADAPGQADVAGVARHLLADRRHPQHRDAVAVARVDHAGQVDDRLRLVLAADEDLHGDGGGVEAQGILHVHGDGTRWRGP